MMLPMAGFRLQRERERIIKMEFRLDSCLFILMRRLASHFRRISAVLPQSRRQRLMSLFLALHG